MDPICAQCNTKLLYTNEIKAYPTSIFKCDKCNDVLMTYYGVWHCTIPECNYDLCNLCKEGLKPHCAKCKGVLQFTMEIKKYTSDCFNCDHCNRKFYIKSGVHHCFGCDEYDICLECRSKMM